MNSLVCLPAAVVAVATLSCALARVLAVEAPPTTAPISAPASDPAMNAMAGPLLPPEFQLFQTRSAFAADGHASSGPEAASSGPEASFILRGIAQIDDHFTALFEDAAGKNAVEAGIGDPVAAGRVKAIDLDEVEYESAGKSRQISVGQNLKGEVVAPIPASKPAAPPGNGPGNGPDAIPPDGGPPQPAISNPKPKRGK